MLDQLTAEDLFIEFFSSTEIKIKRRLEELFSNTHIETDQAIQTSQLLANENEVNSIKKIKFNTDVTALSFLENVDETLFFVKGSGQIKINNEISEFAKGQIIKIKSGSEYTIISEDETIFLSLQLPVQITEAISSRRVS